MPTSRPEIEMGAGILAGILDSIGLYAVTTMPEPWKILSPHIKNPPAATIFNSDMSVENLARIEKDKPDADFIVGLGGGTSCDTAKYLSWKWEIPAIISPSIISVDAWLCRSIAVRDGHRVRYVGDVIPQRLIVDYSLVKKAPPELNRAGVADVISIATALGDWKIAAENFDEKYDGDVFNAARNIAIELMEKADDIRNVTDAGIGAMIKGQLDEVVLCEVWGNARPEEGSEHFLAYRLEEITRGHYIHGNLIALNVLVCLKLQRGHAVFDHNEMKDFFDRAGLKYRPKDQGIRREDYRRALETVGDYVSSENLFKCLWSMDNVFDSSGKYSIDGILDWIYGF